MVGSEEGRWDLELRAVTAEDAGRYQCQVLASPGSAPLRSSYATVTVTSLPEAPLLTSGPAQTVKEASTALVQCISRGGRPAPAVSWSRNGALLEEEADTRTSVLGDLTLITVSTLTFPVSANMTGDSLECEASHEAEDVARTVSTSLVVEFAPIVSLGADTETIYEGDSVKLTCSARANPGLIEYHWSLEGEEVVEGRGARELVLLVDRNFHQKKVSCFARNTKGENMASYSLDVKCK